MWSHNVHVQNATIRNGDDCITVKSGSSNVMVEDLHCKGSHGITVGSVWYDNVVNVTYRRVVMEDCAHGTYEYAGYYRTTGCCCCWRERARERERERERGRGNEGKSLDVIRFILLHMYAYMHARTHARTQDRGLKGGCKATQPSAT